MLGQMVNDPDGIEGSIPSLPGLGLLDVNTTMTQDKATRQVTFSFQGEECHGYEIHQGISDTTEQIVEQGNVLGTYIHGFLDNQAVIDYLLKDVSTTQPTTEVDPYDRLADHVREHVDIERIYSL